jgi:hypothetical protein
MRYRLPALSECGIWSDHVPESGVFARPGWPSVMRVEYHDVAVLKTRVTSYARHDHTFETSLSDQLPDDLAKRVA